MASKPPHPEIVDVSDLGYRSKETTLLLKEWEEQKRAKKKILRGTVIALGSLAPIGVVGLYVADYAFESFRNAFYSFIDMTSNGNY
jgi:hypothetical protein